MKYAKNLNIDISERAISPLKLLWLALADFHNEKSGQCNPSIKTLAICIEKSESQTTLYMGVLKRLGLVVAARNAKGGRYTPQYELPIPCHPADKVVKPPEDDAAQKCPEGTHLTETNKESHTQDPTPIGHRTRILIETLDEPLIKSLVSEKNITIKISETVRLGKKYKFPFKENTPIHEVQAWLLDAIKQSTPHRTNYGNH